MYKGSISNLKKQICVHYKKANRLFMGREIIVADCEKHKKPMKNLCR